MELVTLNTAKLKKTKKGNSPIMCENDKTKIILVNFLVGFVFLLEMFKSCQQKFL